MLHDLSIECIKISAQGKQDAASQPNIHALGLLSHLVAGTQGLMGLQHCLAIGDFPILQRAMATGEKIQAQVTTSYIALGAHRHPTL